MYRRTALATLGCTVLAGCSATNGSDTDSEPQPTETPTPLDTFVDALEEDGTTISAIEQRDGTVELEYVPGGESDQELASEIGVISGSFFREAEALAADRLEAVMASPGGEPLADWYADLTWFESYQAGEMSDDELSVQILETLEQR